MWQTWKYSILLTKEKKKKGEQPSRSKRRNCKRCLRLGKRLESVRHTAWKKTLKSTGPGLSTTDSLQYLVYISSCYYYYYYFLGLLLYNWEKNPRQCLIRIRDTSRGFNDLWMGQQRHYSG